MPPEMQIPNQIHFKIRAFAKSGTGTLNDLTRLEEVGAGVAVTGRTGSAPGVPTGHRIPAQGNTLGTVTASPGVLKERRIFLNRGRLPNPTRCGVPSERLIGGPRIPRVAPWAGMRRPFRADADTPPPACLSRKQAVVQPSEVCVRGYSDVGLLSVLPTRISHDQLCKSPGDTKGFQLGDLTKVG